MSFDDDIGRIIYNHYSGDFTEMSDDDRVSLGSAFRTLHEVAEALSQLDLSAESIPIKGWQDRIKLDHLSNQGYLLKFELWLALGPVGKLGLLIDECKYLCSDNLSASVPENFLYYSPLPDSECLFKEKTISQQWMVFLRSLRERYVASDTDLQKMMTDLVDVQFFLFNGYLLITLLHQVVSILEFAELVSGGSERIVGPETS